MRQRLAPLEGASDKQKAGVAIIAGFKHVYRLTTAMRLDDPVLVAVLSDEVASADSGQE